MKGAAAALAGAVLFFLGVLTGTPGGDRLSPPRAIPLGTESRTAGSPGRAPGAGAVPPATPGPTTPGASAGTPPAGQETPPPPPAPGSLEQVGGRVDCVKIDKKGPGGDCPPGQNNGPGQGGGGGSEGPGNGGGSDATD